MIILDLDNKYLDFTSVNGVSRYVHTKILSKLGMIGNASLATVQKGEKMWKIIIHILADFVGTIKNTSSDKLYQNKF